MKKTSRITLIAMLIVMPFLGWRCYRWCEPTFKVVAASNSPDGRFKYVVEWKPPPHIMASPNLYRGRIIDNQTGRIVPGTEWEKNNDSCMDPVLEKPHVWTRQEIGDLEAKMRHE